MTTALRPWICVSVLRRSSMQPCAPAAAAVASASTFASEGRALLQRLHSPLAAALAGDGGRDNYFVFAASLVVREASFPRLAMDRSHCETHRTCAQFSGK